MTDKPILPRALVIRRLLKTGKTVWVMFEGGKITHTILKHNIDTHALIGTYYGEISAQEISDDLHFAIEQWRKER